MKTDGKCSDGFSLVEVNLAILMVAVGLLTLFALFPLGLRESDMSIVDTHEAMFADTVLSALEGEAIGITNWATWNNIGSFKAALTGKLPEFGDEVLNVNGARIETEFCGSTLRYELTIEDNGPRKTAVLKVRGGAYGDFDENAQTYFTQFIYTGM